MTTATIKRDRFTRLSIPNVSLVGYNTTAIFSIVFAGLFMMYFLVPHVGILKQFFNLSFFYVLVAPLAAFILAVISMRQILRSDVSHSSDGGLIMSVSALVVTSLYFIVALAIPLVLLCCYVVYTYLLK